MNILIVIAALIVLLVVVLGINTAIQTGRARKLVGEHPSFTNEELEKYGRSLQEMVQCKTISVRGSYDDTEFAKLRNVIEKQFPLLHEKAEHRLFSDDCWFFKIPGKDASRNILLMSHHDVVDADEKWSHDPFGGEIVDGKIFGRGTADTKGSLCGILHGMEQLLAEGFQPEVNVYVVSSHNEELGGDGITSVRDYFQENGIHLEVVLDEGGASVDPPLGNMNGDMCAMVAVHEKGRCRVTCSATWASNHVSLTGYKNNPVERMAGFVQEVSKGGVFITDLNPQVRSMFSKLAPYCGFPMNVLFCNLWLFGGLIQKVLPKINATAGGMIGTTCAFSSIQGSTNDKICKATAMLRNVNDEDLKKDLAAFRKVAEKYGVQVDVEYEEYYKPADMNSAAYAYTFECLAKVFPKFPAAPYILPAGTDAWKLTPVCDCVLRFAPTRMNGKQLGSIHAVDENLDVAAVAEAASFYEYFVKNYR